MLTPNYQDPSYNLIMEAKQRFVGSLLEKSIRKFPERIALEFQGKTMTYSELNSEVNKLANGLLKLGVKRGDVIAACFRNRMESVVFLYAVARIGAIVTFMNWRYTVRETIETMQVINPVLICSASTENELVAAVLPEIETCKWVMYMDDIDPAVTSVPICHYTDIVASGEDVDPKCELCEEDLFFIVFTSGTTGIPKAAALSQRAFVNRVKNWIMLFGQKYHTDHNDCLMARGAFVHVTSVCMTFGAHALGGRSIILDGFTPADMVDIYEQYPITWGSMDPSMIDRFCDEIDSRGPDWKPAGVRVCGALLDPAPNVRLKRLSLALRAPLFNSYGSTEISFYTFSYGCLQQATPDMDPNVYADKRKEEGFDVDVRLVDSNGNDVKEGEPGELVVRTSLLFSGYYNNPEVNAEDFRGGWFHTGDVLKRYPDGKYDFVSRVKFMIKPGGENVYPAEIERVFLTHPAVRECSVVGCPHPKWNETPVAFVALRDGETITGPELREYCREHLSGFKVPSLVVLRPYADFRFNETGKVVREVCESWLPEILATNPFNVADDQLASFMEVGMKRFSTKNERQ